MWDLLENLNASTSKSILFDGIAPGVLQKNVLTSNYCYVLTCYISDYTSTMYSNYDEMRSDFS